MASVKTSARLRAVSRDSGMPAASALARRGRTYAAKTSSTPTMSAEVATFAAPPRPASQVKGSWPIRLPGAHRFPDGRHREARQTQGEPDRIWPKYGSRGEGQPAEPHEGEEFNKRDPNSKAWTPTDERSEPHRVEQNREADC